MTGTMTVSINKGNFSRGLSTVKKWGFSYNPDTKHWTGKVPMALQSPIIDVPGYLRQVSLTLVTSDRPSTVWQGSKSMDAEDSIF